MHPSTILWRIMIPLTNKQANKLSFEAKRPKITLSAAFRVSAMASSLVSLLLLVATTSATVPYECLDPPGNGPVADAVVDKMNASRSIIAAGIPDLGIPPLDPFGPFPHINFKVDADGTRLAFRLHDSIMMHLSQFIICQLNITSDIRKKFDLDLMYDHFLFSGTYDLDGIVSHIFPVYGAGDYRINVTNGGIFGSGSLTLNIFTQTYSLSNFEVDIFYDEVIVQLDAIFGGGDMAELVNSVINKISPPMFDAVWEMMKPTLSKALEDGINLILSEIKIPDLEQLGYEYLN